MQVKPKYKGKLRMLKTSVSLPRYVIDDLRQMARIKGMSSYQSVLRELLAEKIYEEKRRLDLKNNGVRSGLLTDPDSL